MSRKLMMSSAIVAVGLLVAQSVILPTSQVYAKTEESIQGESQDERNTLTITDEQLLEGAKIAYESGEISKKDYQSMYSVLTQRSNVKGVTKVVEVDGETHELYLNSKHAGMLVDVGVSSVIKAIMSIPALAAWAATYGLASTVLTTLLGEAVTGSIDTSNGIVITLKKGVKAMPGGYTEPTWRARNVRSQ